MKRCAHFDPEFATVNPDKFPTYEVSKDPKEWEYVKRLLPQTEIPEAPTEVKKYPSGWKPQLGKFISF